MLNCKMIIIDDSRDGGMAMQALEKVCLEVKKLSEVENDC